MSRFDLVTRQEFDIQRGVLKRTRAKLEELEARLAELEGTAAEPSPATTKRKRAKSSKSD